ncbi:MAG: AmmeMemoRadiSam system protein B [Deltaproteobacteria bacterium]|nr:MAG: AmmeMemoRadiSam system protein B [Deltaproteobacteria bacterium]
MVRRPVAAGTFYPGDRVDLRNAVTELLTKNDIKRQAISVIAPHAGYFYSGRVAGKVFSFVEIPETVILLGPNHTGMGDSAAVFAKGSWITPLGEVPIDEGLAKLIIDADPLYTNDELAHIKEHSIEVMLPFLQTLQHNLKIVPIALSIREPSMIKKAGRILAEAIKTREEPVLIVVSSDMTHYLPHDEVVAHDALAIEQLEKLDPEGLLSVVAREGITMCGVIPAAVMLHAAMWLGVRVGERIAYETSGKSSGDFTSVVGYAGMVFN